ncbi:MAG TPA: (d)CMP kinase [Bacteroidales bacterium]|nr:(d)CMP kinase [Bacteroidales bacterium]
MALPRDVIIAIDGYSSCGKSTFARAIARRYQLIYIDTGAMYRAVTLFALRNNIIGTNHFNRELLIAQLPQLKIEFKKIQQSEKEETYLNGENVEQAIRDLQVASFVSQVSAVKEVRAKMVELQRAMGNTGGVVLDGRDVGTVVFPQAHIKIFMTADPVIRAQRRMAELLAKGEQANFEEVYNNLIERDRLDTTREESPLIQAPDAIVLDNSYMTPEQQMEWFEALVKNKFGDL